MKVVFIDPIFKVQAKPFFNLGNLSLASLLKGLGYDVQIINTNHLLTEGSITVRSSPEDFYSEVVSYILASEPDIIDFYSLAGSYHTCLEISRRIKAMYPHIKIVLGGPQAALTAESSLRLFPWIDIIGIGEGEPAIVDLIQAFSGQMDYSEVPNIVYRDGDTICLNKHRKWIEDLDTLPFPDYSLIPNLDHYSEIPVETGRGCPFNCSFCASQKFWAKKIRNKSNARILNEIKTLYETTNCSRFSMIHDLFTLQRTKFIEFCELMASENLPVVWKCCSRADTLDEEMIRTMAAGRCAGVLLGIETGSQQMQKRINKNLNLNVVFPVIDLLKKYGLEIRLSFLYGFPGESRQDIEKTLSMIQLAVEKNADYVSLQECVIFPGTELHQENRQNLVLKDSCTYFITDPFPQERDMVEKHPDIFPYYYRPDNFLLRELTHLDVFISNFFMIPFPYMRRTLNRILHYFNNNLLALFEDFNQNNPEFPELIIRGRSIPYPENDPYAFFISIFELYEQFLIRSRFEQHCAGITSIFKNEKDTFRFLHG